MRDRCSGSAVSSTPLAYLSATWAERAPRSAGRRADKGRLCRLRSLRPQGRPLHGLRRRPVPAPRQDALASSIFKVPWGDLGSTTLVELAWPVRKLLFRSVLLVWPEVQFELRFVQWV